MDTQAAIWMVEILGDGTGPRHRRFSRRRRRLRDRNQGYPAFARLDKVITASTKLSDNAAEVAALQAGEVRQI